MHDYWLELVNMLEVGSENNRSAVIGKKRFLTLMPGKGSLRKLALSFLALLFLLQTGCGVWGGIASILGSNAISGSVPALQIGRSNLVSSNRQGTSGDKAVSCSAATVSLYQLNAFGALILPALSTVALNADGTYSFPETASLGIEAEAHSLNGSYLVRVLGCNTIYSRVLTGLSGQDVTFGSSLISYVLSTAKASALANASQSQVNQLIGLLSSYGDYETAYTSLSSDANASALFTAVTGAAPSILMDAAPIVMSLSAPTAAHEGSTISLVASVTQWHIGYPYAYVWQLDGQTIATTASPNYTLTANLQGMHVLSVFYGQTDSSNNFNQTKPYGTQSFQLEVSNDLPATPPVLSVVGSPNITTTSVPLQIATGASLSNCASFSALAITENSVNAPLNRSDFTITCSQSPTQNFTYTLTTGTGAKILSLWAIDASNNISLVPSQAMVTYNLPVLPSVVLTTTASNPTNSSMIEVTATFSEAVTGLTSSSISVSNGTTGTVVGTGTTYIFEVTPISQGGVTVEVLAGAATDSAGNPNLVSNTLSVTYDSVAPVLSFTAPANNSVVSVSNENSLTVTGTCSKPGTVNLALGALNAAATCSGTNFSTTIDAHSLADGAYTLTANMTDAAGNVATQQSLSLVKNTPTSLTISGFASSVLAGAGQSVTVTVLDQAGVAAPKYTGTIQFTSSSANSALPANYTFTAADAGVHTFSGVSLNTSGTQSLTVTDTSAAALTTTQSGITVGPASADPTQSTITANPTVTLADGTSSIALVVVLKDYYGNAVPNKSVALTTSGTGQTLTQPATQTDSSGRTSGSIVATAIGNRTISISSPTGLTTLTQSANFTGNLGAFTIAAYPQDGQITVVWTAAANASGYTVGYSTMSGVYTSTACAATSALSCTVTGLSNGTTYYFMVTASNGVTTLNATAQTSTAPASVTPAITSPSSTTPVGGLATPLANTTFTVTGTGFQYGAVVTLDGTSCTNSVTYISPTSLTCTIPNAPTASFIGWVSVSVTNTDGVAASQSNAFAYLGQPSLWLSADNGALDSSGNPITVNGTSVATWNDLSGNSNNFTQSTASARPTFAAALANSKPGIFFNYGSSSQYLSLGTSALGQDVDGLTSIASVQFSTITDIHSDYLISISEASGYRFQHAAKYNSGDRWTVDALRIDGTDTNQTLAYNSNVPLTTQVIGSAQVNYNSSTNNFVLWQNGTQLTSASKSWTSSVGPTSNTASTAANIGVNSNIYISEMLLYPAALVSADRLVVEEYLGIKYGVTVP